MDVSRADPTAPHPTPSVRLAELIAPLSLATDLGTGQPLERGLRACLVASRLADHLHLSPEDRSDAYYLPLVAMLGCTAESGHAAAVFGDELAFGAAVAPFFLGERRETLRWMLAHYAEEQPPVRRAIRLFRAMIGAPSVMAEAAVTHCEVAQTLCDRLGFGAGLRRALGAIYARWDGTGSPPYKKESIPLATRIMHVAWDAQLFYRLGGQGRCIEMARARAGHALDPGVVDALCRHAADVLAPLDAASVWDAVLGSEPGPSCLVAEADLDSAVTVFADFVDLKSTWLHGHSRRVADLAAEAARRRRLAPLEVQAVRRAGLVHDLGRVAVSASIWDRTNALGPAERERIRLHSYYTERVLAHSPALAPLAEVAGRHHERLDGSGYHRGVSGPSLTSAARLLAAADVYDAVTHARPHRAALQPAEAADVLREESRAGRLDADASDAVLAAAGHVLSRQSRRTYPGGLSEREVDVLRLLGRGQSNRVMAATLSISESTVHHHIQHIYDKLGVSTRAAATLFAMQHGLL